MPLRTHSVAILVMAAFAFVAVEASSASAQESASPSPAPVATAAAPSPVASLPANATPSASPTAGNQPKRHGQPGATGEDLLPPIRTRKEEEAKKSLIDLTLSLARGFATGPDQLVLPGQLNDTELLPAGALLINLTPRFSLFERRTNHADVSGRIYKKGKPTYSGLGYDIEYDTGASYDVTKDLNLDVFDRVRWRTCCPSAGDAENKQPRLERAFVTGATYRFGPKTVVGKPITAHLEGVLVDHHLDLGTKVPTGTNPPGSLLVYRSSLFFQVPVFGSQFVPFIGFEHFMDYFDNNLVPSTTNRSDYGFRLKGTSFVSYRVYVQNDHQTNPGGNVPHKVTLYTEASFHLHI